MTHGCVNIVHMIMLVAEDLMQGVKFLVLHPGEHSAMKREREAEKDFKKFGFTKGRRYSSLVDCPACGQRVCASTMSCHLDMECPSAAQRGANEAPPQGIGEPRNIQRYLFACCRMGERKEGWKSVHFTGKEVCVE